MIPPDKQIEKERRSEKCSEYSHRKHSGCNNNPGNGISTKKNNTSHNAGAGEEIPLVVSDNPSYHVRADKTDESDNAKERHHDCGNQ